MRRLIVNADDLGASVGVNRGIAQAWQHGVVTSASLMVDGSAAAEAAEWARATPALSVGLHLDLAEWEYVGGQWQCRYARVDTANADEVGAEIDRQLGAFLRLLGQAPTHLDSHQHLHREEPVCSLLDAVGDRLGVPVRGRPDNQIGYRGDFYGQTGKGEPYWRALTIDALLAVLDGLPEGTTELGCHPGFVDDLDSTYRIEREMETRVLCEPAVRDRLNALGISLTSHRRPAA